jgi:bla regulator protein BlaR1
MIAMMIVTMLSRGTPTLTGWRSVPTLTGWGLMGSGWMPEWGGVFNHLWQSTVFAAAAALLALALRKNHARARYWLWLAASCKFLVPFALLVTLGANIGTSVQNVIGNLWPSAPTISAQPEMTIMIDEISQPFTQVSIPAAAPEHHSMLSAILPELLLGLWIAGCAIVLISWFRRWLRVRAAVRAAKVISFSPTLGRVGSENTRALTGAPQVAGHGPAPRRIRIMSSPALIEPGIFGIFRPVLLLPEGIADRLTPAQLKSILAHELCHVKRRDNLAAAMHMIVEAAFWFHPLVWWIGARLVEERERACDEEVLQSGSEPGVYAESILQVCKFYLESPLKCVAGVTGSDLKKRIESIMNGLPGRNLTPVRKLMLIAASIGAVAGPVLVGVLTSSRIHAQSQATRDSAHPAFEVASVKPNKTADNRNMGVQFLPGGGLSAKGVPLYLLIVFAYDLPIQTSRISGGPEWLRSDRFDIEAKADKDAIPPGATVRAREAKTRLMLQALLADRFKLVIRTEKKELSVYAAVVGKNGPKLQKAKVEEKDCPDTGTTVAGTTCHTFFGGMGRGLHGDAVDMPDLVGFVANWTDRPVIDKTGIQGLYNIQTDGWVPMTPSQPSPDGTVSDEAQAIADPARPTLQVIFDRLGLKLEAQKAPIDMYVIEHAERPSDNFEPPTAAAQAPAQPARSFEGPTPSFEVASIKPRGPAVIGPGFRSSTGSSPGMLNYSNVTLRTCIQKAYGVRPYQISGGPNWLGDERFDIMAKAASIVPEDQMMTMLRKLLEQRFKLTTHREAKEMPVYALVVRKNGPKIHAVKDDDGGTQVDGGDGHQISVRNLSMEGLVQILSRRQQTDRPVLDRTGLKGVFNFTLDFATDDAASADGTAGPSIFTAVQEQLGLKLEATKGPVEIIVIDHVEKPSDNFEPPVAKQGDALHLPAAALDGSIRSHTVAPQMAVGAKRPAFEVASIRPSKSTDGRTVLGGDAGRFTATNVTVKKLIENAYGIKDFQVSGGPGWAGSDLFDISAKSESAMKPEELWLAIQSLLAERFKLVIRRETKEMPVYALAVAKSGPKFKSVKATDPNIADPGGRSDDLPPGVRPRFMIVRRGRFTGQGIDMETLAWRLTGFLGRTVVDKTGLKAQYDLKLEWVPDENQIAMFQAIGVPEGNGAPPADWHGPSLFTALQEQLGLKLDSQKGPVEMFVIEHVEKPSDNFEPPVAKQEGALHLPAAALDGSIRSHTVAPLSAKPQSQPAPPAGKPLAFEVASIRPNKIGSSGGEGSRRENITTSPGTLSMSNVTLKSCIKWAYSVQDPQLSAGPDWLTGDRFDVIAKTAEPAPESQLRLMLQALLADRFKLALHRESKTLAGYALAVGKNGPKLQPSEGEGAPQFQGRNARVDVTRYSMQDLAEFLAGPLQTYVANMTGLKGRFDFSIDVLPFLSTDGPIVKEDMASAFERALEQQVGLKLEGRRFPVEVLVIDHAEKPSEN